MFQHESDYTDKGDFDLKDERSYAFVGLKQDWNYGKPQQVSFILERRENI